MQIYPSLIINTIYMDIAISHIIITNNKPQINRLLFINRRYAYYGLTYKINKTCNIQHSLNNVGNRLSSKPIQSNDFLPKSDFVSIQYTHGVYNIHQIYISNSRARLLLYSDSCSYECYFVFCCCVCIVWFWCYRV